MAKKNLQTTLQMNAILQTLLAPKTNTASVLIALKYGTNCLLTALSTLTTKTLEAIVRRVRFALRWSLLNQNTALSLLLHLAIANFAGTTK
jgi:hypothetical protein